MAYGEQVQICNALSSIRDDSVFSKCVTVREEPYRGIVSQGVTSVLVHRL
jgi:hypothetical protein